MVLIGFILALLILGVVYYVAIRPVPELGKGAVAIGPTKDKLCVTRSEAFGEGEDDDRDKRDDYLCDSCVCDEKSYCSNDLKSQGGADNDGDGLPWVCDKDDTDKTNIEFHPINCPENKLLNLGDVWGKQCRPDISKVNKTNIT